MLRSLLLIALAAGALRSATQTPATPRPTDVPELLRQAQAKATARDFAGAAALMQRVVQLNPVKASHWYSLGTTLYRAEDFAAASRAYERAAELGAPIL